MVGVTMHWSPFHVLQGDQPGENAGNVTIHLVNAVGGETEFTVPSGDVSLAAEAGSVIGVQLVTADRRRLFVPIINVSAIVDSSPGGV